MAGIVGILAFDKIWNISKFMKYSLMGLQHRGYSSSGYAILNDKISSGHFSSPPEDIEINEHGWAGIGYTGSKEGYPIVFDDVALVIDGVIKEDPKIIAEKVLSSPEDLKDVRGAFSLIALTSEGKIIAYRDESGLKPLAIGGFGFDMAIVASEMTAMSVIGGEFRREINPGEMIILDKYNIESKKLKEPKKSYCSIEYIYQARIDSFVNEKSIYELRIRIGEELAREKPIDADTVIGVPDTAIPFAIGYSRVTGIPLDLGFTRTGSPIRTMLASNDFMKIVGVQLKLNVIKSAVFGKRVILIDDSMVTGTTLKNTIFSLRKMGAKEVHVLIGSPKLISYCPYGVEVPQSSELIAANLSEEEIAKVLGADSIYWLSIDGLYKVIGSKQLCLGCMLNSYPKVI
ncbi:amidophosphoribosyltransferase [Acidianus ambivalens]|uniref:Amidophosphoribosyltransferase n=1 Tax=Acidianus ambivalens TaxID=2283 RepID=A0A650CSE5_ACIAM|nr:amidophosphoribosyltransferase [Acidianus ambivalens]MQL55103.1 amidophosphoribosyltransferase [Acidianus ambivalens]QGR20655.1 amidophosphoribosyltransferase [Acidianus ambivalens]